MSEMNDFGKYHLMKTIEEIEHYLDNIQFLSPNEPLTRWGLLRVLQ